MEEKRLINSSINSAMMGEKSLDIGESTYF